MKEKKTKQSTGTENKLSIEKKNTLYKLDNKIYVRNIWIKNTLHQPKVENLHRSLAARKILIFCK